MVTKQFRKLQARLRALEAEHEARGFNFGKRWTMSDRAKQLKLLQNMEEELDIIDMNYETLERKLK